MKGREIKMDIPWTMKKLSSSKEMEDAARWPSRIQILFSDDDNAGGKSAFTIAIAPRYGGAYC